MDLRRLGRQSGQTNLTCTATVGVWVDGRVAAVVVVVAKLVYLRGIKAMYTSNQFKPYIVVPVCCARRKEGRTDRPAHDNLEADGLRQSRLHSGTGVGGGSNDGYLT